jgi:hypothetical protein
VYNLNSQIVSIMLCQMASDQFCTTYFALVNFACGIIPCFYLDRLI